MQEPVPLSQTAPPGRWGTRADVLAVGLVLAFAFVAASFVARNSDLWLHLATGRARAAGEYHFGTDPFAYTTEGRYWANHAWLSDLGLYLAFTSFGGNALVAIKAVLVAATAALMLLAARTRGPVWVAVGCVLLAVLAASPRLLLQPTIVSLFLLAGCLCCLRYGGRALRAVPVLIAVWVNVDAWFVLGPALVALFWLGRRIDPERAAVEPWPRWLAPTAFGACLLSPHHIFALRLPSELSPAVWNSDFATDPRFAGVFAHPWHWGPLGPAGGYSPAVWAFFALLALGVVSFALNRRAVRSWRFAVWLPFAALGAWQSRLIPFFAVVAAPITALNLAEMRATTEFARVGRFFVLVASVALLALGWAGWLTGVNARDRGLAWGVHSDPTLVRAATGVSEWRHATGAPAESRVFATHPDVGHYLAWHAPGERYFMDSRLSLFADSAGAFTDQCRAVGVLSQGEGKGLPDSVAAIIVYDPDTTRVVQALRSVGARWGVSRIDGASALLVRAEARLRFDPERAAFGGESTLPVAWDGPARVTEPGPGWSARDARGRTGSWEAGAGAVYLRLADASEAKSPALPLLAVRAARAGAEVDPKDPLAWLVLGRAYLSLGRTWEAQAGAGLTPLEHVRFVQTTAALTQAALLDPDSVAAHDSLAHLYLRRSALDLAHRHAAAAARLVRRNGPATTEPADQFAARRDIADARADATLAAVQDAENRYLVRTEGLTGEPLTRARIALELGLVQKALDVLLGSHPDLYGTAGVGLLADLLLQSGQVEECRTLLDRKELRTNPGALGVYALPRKPNPDGARWTYQLPAYEWLDLMQRAAAGQYAAAQAAVERLCERLEAQERASVPVLVRNSAALAAGDIGRGAPLAPVLNRVLGVRQRIALDDFYARARVQSVTRADLLTVAGAFDLERGDPRAGAARFEAALALYAGARDVPVSRPGEALATRYHDAVRAAR